MKFFRENKTRIILTTIALQMVVLFGYWFWLEQQRKEIRHEVRTIIKETADKSDLVLLKFSPADLCSPQIKWKHSKEFKYQNQMYDIIEAQIKNDSIYYWCWEDNEENQLNKKMDNLIAYFMGVDPNQEEQRTVLTNLGRSLYVDPIPEFNFDAPILASERDTPFGFDFYKNLEYPIPTPPPEFYFEFS